MPSQSALSARSGRRTRRFRRLARTGFAVNGLIHVLIGATAIGLAFGDDSVDEVDPSGAIARLASTPLGLTVAWAAFSGLVALGLWQLTRFVGGTVADEPITWGRRISEAGKGLASLALGGTTLVFALGGSTSSSTTIRRINTELISSPLGSWILVAVGLTVLGSGIGFVVIGIRRGFRKLVRIPLGRRGAAVLSLGAAGYLAKGVALGIVGAIFVVAAATGDARQASGLDGALRFLAVPPYGTAALVIIGIGLIGYGVFLVARAKLARL
ncbi:DUF1206 domain-containing protein [Microbacteriaceae bacterium VKM Ac-2855]|nr:DUF1206 domain-containing protein [Microbacteriaceae bacterium VKM Ac-2855]